MAFELNSINISLQGGKITNAFVYFDQRVQNNDFFISGSLRLTGQEYLENAADLTPFVQQRLNEYVNGTYGEDDTEDEGVTASGASADEGVRLADVASASEVQPEQTDSNNTKK